MNNCNNCTKVGEIKSHYINLINGLLFEELKTKVTTHYENYFKDNTETDCYYELIVDNHFALHSYSDLITEIEYIITQDERIWYNLIVTPEYHTEDSIIPMDEIINLQRN